MVNLKTRKIKMNTWFFKIEGHSEANDEIDYPFGFYVNCLITTNKKIKSAKKIIENDLKIDNYNISKIEQSGEFKDFCWDETEIQEELDNLAIEAEENQGIVYYSNFHIWEL